MKNIEINYRHLIDTVHEGIWFIDSAFTIIHANKHITKMFGYPGKEQKGKSIFDFLDEKASVFLRKNLKNQSRGTPKQHKCKLHRKDGSDVLVNLRTTPVSGKNGEFEGAFVIITDITGQKLIEENKEIEARIRHTQKLETLGLQAGGIAHDINNLLGTILGNADLALLKLFPKSPLFNHISNIKTTTLRTSALTGQMLAYSGRDRFIIKPVDINMLIEEMAGLLKVSISKNITLKFRFADNLPTVEADGVQIRQVIMNLITNASEAIGDKNSGIISIKTGIEKSGKDSCSLMGKYVFMEIADTGYGMDDKTREKIFDPFYTTKSTGRGLGLRIVREIVRGHKGTITVQSEPGKGTVFKIMFPASEKPLKVKEQVEKSIGKAYTAGGTILIIDDEEDVRDVTRTMLETINFKVHTASNGQDGIKFFRKNYRKIDVILIDMTMPDMRGEDVFKEMRTISSDVPVIISSGYSEHDVKRRFSKRDVATFIHKPYQMKTLIDKISTIMKSKH